MVKHYNTTIAIIIKYATKLSTTTVTNHSTHIYINTNLTDIGFVALKS